MTVEEQIAPGTTVIDDKLIAAQIKAISDLMID